MKIEEICSLEDCDKVTVEDLEAGRKVLGLTPVEIAERLVWSVRKYQRMLDAVREDGFAPRDVVLSFVGMFHIDGGIKANDSSMVLGEVSSKLFRKSDYSYLLLSECERQREEGHEWTADVTPHVLRILALQAQRGLRITYNDLAEWLESEGVTGRVWPRTPYGRPLGAVCRVITELGRLTSTRIPLLSVIVVRQNGLPGQGFDEMTKEFFKIHEPEKARSLNLQMRNDRNSLINVLQKEVLAFRHWAEVSAVLGLNKTRQ